MAGATFLLLPGAGGAAWSWHLVDPELRRRGHDVIAVDLPADDETAGLARYVEIAAAAVRGREHLVVVGLSMGAFTATALCARVPADLLVLVNPMIPAPGEAPAQWGENVGHAGAMRANDIAHGRDPDAELDSETYFMHDVAPEVAAAGAEHEKPEAAIAFDSPLDIEHWPDVPTRVVAGRDDRLLPIDLQRRVARDRLGLAVDAVPGGHMSALSHPVELAAVLDRCWSELVAGRT